MDEYLNFIESVKRWDDYKYVVTSLAEEAMEFQQAAKVTKMLRGDEPVCDVEAIKKELGDVLFFWVAACDAYGFEPWEIINTNLLKLTDRAARNVIQGSGDNR